MSSASIRALALLVAAALTPHLAAAQDEAPPGASSRNAIRQPGERPRDDDMSLATATPDPTPEPRQPSLDQPPELAVTEQAGVGGPVPFGATGVLEVGGSAYISGNEYELVTTMRPFVGLFVLDGFQLGVSAELLIRYGAPHDDLRLSHIGALDANFYAPLNTTLWFQIGIGVGGLYNGSDGGVVGLARSGLVVLVGRSGMIHFLVNGGAASAPFVDPVQTDTMHSHFRVGGEVTYAVLF